MDFLKKETQSAFQVARENILNQCIGCECCLEECFLLQQIGETPDQIAERGPTTKEAFSCFLCGLCSQICPFFLDIGQMFNLKRVEALKNDEVSASDYCYLFPDREVNIMSLYRELTNTNYAGLNVDSTAAVAFFPGCTMLTYAPKVTIASFEFLQNRYEAITLLTDCCGLPLRQFGLALRADAYIKSLKNKLSELQAKTLVVACPNCYYELRKNFINSDIKIKNIYEVMRESLTGNRGLKFVPAITIHDSCHDRYEGIFARQVREILEKMGCNIVEMEHSFDRTICCGSGGQVTHFQLELANSNVECRLKEAGKVGSEMLVSYCMACVLNFAMHSEKIKSKHALNLILGVDEKYSGIKEKSRALFSGPEGEKNWELLLAN